MSERKQPDRILKKRTREMMAKSKPRKKDIIGELLSNYGEMTGGNITREIFSYLDFSTLQQGRLVAKSWNHFLSNDKKIWLQALEKQLPNLIYFTNRLAENDEENSTFWKEVWSRIDKDDNISPKELIDSFKRVQNIFEVVKICAKSKLVGYKNFHTVDYLPFHDDFVGEKVKKEIRREIKRNENLLYSFTSPLIRTSEVGVEVPEGLNWSPIIANLLGSWNWNLQNPHQFGTRRIQEKILVETRRIQEKILVEIKKYLLNE